MAAYKYTNHLTQSSNTVFDLEHTPGQIPSHSGIYRCVNCGDEVAANKGQPLPPQNHHQHRHPTRPIRWKLLVMAQQI